MEIEEINLSNKKADASGDNVVDMAVLNIILSHRNQSADVCPECDLDGDGMITALDARKCFKHPEIFHREGSI